MEFCLNDNQRQMVEEHLDIVNKVIRRYIRVNQNICGMKYDDIYQVGAIGLCKAVATYQENAGVKFETYASKVVKNTILDHLKSILRKKNSQEKSLLILQTEQEYWESFDDTAALEALQQAKERYTGTALKGIEAIEMKMQGYRGKDIAQIYQVKANYISACVSRAKKCLQKDKIFLELVEKEGETA